MFFFFGLNNNFVQLLYQFFSSVFVVVFFDGVFRQDRIKIISLSTSETVIFY